MTQADPIVTNHSAEAAFQKLLSYCQANSWAGYDPYDALNSKVFEALPFLNHRVPRIVLTQALKRSPVNIRRLMLIPKTQNAKAIALFLTALLKLPENELAGRESLVKTMIDLLSSLRSPGTPYWCWGYSFPWQGRTVVVPAGAPNLVCTCFAANALVDAYEHDPNPQFLSRAASAAEHMLNELYWTDGASACGFSYPRPSLKVQVHNANFLAAALLCRLFKHTGEERFLAAALKVAEFSASKQHADGSWNYGEAPSQRWIDNFHTGFNLCALKTIARYAGTTEFDVCIQRGFEFYRSRFFREDGAVAYFHNQTYPIDIHCVAQSIITLIEFDHLDSGNVPLANSVFQWAMQHLWDDRGFFYYRRLRSCTIRTSYMRWSQAWMFLAISRLLGKPAMMASEPQRGVATRTAEA